MNAAIALRRPLLTTIVAIIATIYMLALTIPWIPLRSATLWHFDYSWMLVLHDAIATGRQFGPQLIVPYGPLGFLATNVYDPRTYLVLIAIRILLSLMALHVLWDMARKLLPNPIAALFWLMAIIAMMGPGITAHDAMSGTFNPRTLGGSEDHFFSICAVLLLVAYFSVHERAVSRSAVAMVVVLAAASLAKVNFLLQDLVVIGAITLDQIISARGWRRWLVPAVYVGSLCVFSLLARQSPANLGAFLWGWAQVSMGHMDAVGFPGALTDVIAFLVVAALVLILVARVAGRQKLRPAIIHAAAMALFFALLFKHSFVRQDFAHATIAPMVALTIAILYVPIAWARSRGRLHQSFCIATVTLAGVLVWSNLTEYTDPWGLAGYAWDTVQRSEDAFVAVTNDLTTPLRLHQQWEADRASVRVECALPPGALAGPTDVYPHRQDVLFAYSLLYDPRPAFSSLFATAPALAELNARHLQGPAAPETILFDIEPIDEQFPSLADGRSWPELLSRYDVADASGAMLVLHRSARPRSYRLRPMVTLNGRLNERVVIARASSGPLWARIRMKRRTAGRIISALYKPPLVQIEVRTRDKSETQYRLLPALAEQGFLLSPVVGSRGDFVKLARSSWEADLSQHAVETITISVVDGSAELNYDSRFTVDLDRLEISR